MVLGHRQKGSVENVHTPRRGLPLTPIWLPRIEHVSAPFHCFEAWHYGRVPPRAPQTPSSEGVRALACAASDEDLLQHEGSATTGRRPFASQRVLSAEVRDEQDFAGVSGEELYGFVNLAEFHAVGDEPVKFQFSGVQ